MTNIYFLVVPVSFSLEDVNDEIQQGEKAKRIYWNISLEEAQNTKKSIDKSGRAYKIVKYATQLSEID